MGITTIEATEATASVKKTGVQVEQAGVLAPCYCAGLIILVP